MASTPAQIYILENSFYRRTAIALAVLMLVGFGLFNLLGLTSISAMPTSTYLHGIIMFSWLLLFVVQNYLGTGRNLALHRKLGWFGVALALAGVLTAWNTGFVTTTLDRAPPIFYTDYFLALNLITPVFFASFVAAAVILRKRTDWHRRLMLGAIVMVTEPALGRLSMMVSVPLLGGPDRALPFLMDNRWFVPTVELALHVLIVALIAWRDRSIRGTVHPAIKLLLVAVPLFYASVWLVAAIPPFADYAFALKGSGL